MEKSRLAKSLIVLTGVAYGLTIGYLSWDMRRIQERMANKLESIQKQDKIALETLRVGGLESERRTEELWSDYIDSTFNYERNLIDLFPINVTPIQFDIINDAWEGEYSRISSNQVRSASQ